MCSASEQALTKLLISCQYVNNVAGTLRKLKTLTLVLSLPLDPADLIIASLQYRDISSQCTVLVPKEVTEVICRCLLSIWHGYQKEAGVGRVCFWWFSLSKCEDLSKYPLYWWLCFHCLFPFGCKLFMGWMNFSTFSFFSIGEFASWLLGRPSVWKWGSFVIPNIRIGQQSIPCQDIFWGWIFKKHSTGSSWWKPADLP